jgi:pantetheine-phosphate adenylyltransferase
VIALYPGSFDPITLGHLDLVTRASGLFDQVIVAIGVDSGKQPLFTVEERREQIAKATHHLPNVRVDSFLGLTVRYAQEQQCRILIRGLRVVSDFEKELQMAQTNRTLDPLIETVFLATAAEYSFVSSSAIREIARLGGSVKHLVPPHVEQDLVAHFTGEKP